MEKRRFVEWWKEDKRYITLLKAVLLALLPLLCCLIRTIVEGESISRVYLPASEWNDELFYFKQVEGIVNYGFPQGYFGFNESHALQLSFAAWSPVLVFPWILWGILSGWNLLSPVICNIVLLYITMFVFVWLVKPDWKQTGILAVLFSLFTLFVRYMLSGMPEVICFSMLILFYGVAMSYLKKESRAKLIAMFVISVLLTLMRPYMLLFLGLACFFWIRRNRKTGWIGSILVVAVTGIAYALIKHYLGAEYFTPLFYTDWITTFFTDGIAAGFRNFFGTLHWKGLEFYRHCVSGIRNGLASGAFFDGYLLLFLILLAQIYGDRKRLRTAKQVEKIVMKPENPEVRKAVFGQMMLTEEQKKALRDELVILIHFAISLAAMLFAHLLMYKMVEGSKHFLTFIAAGVCVGIEKLMFPLHDPTAFGVQAKFSMIAGASSFGSRKKAPGPCSWSSVYATITASAVVGFTSYICVTSLYSIALEPWNIQYIFPVALLKKSDCSYAPLMNESPGRRLVAEMPFTSDTCPVLFLNLPRLIASVFRFRYVQ